MIAVSQERCEIDDDPATPVFFILTSDNCLFTSTVGGWDEIPLPEENLRVRMIAAYEQWNGNGNSIGTTNACVFLQTMDDRLFYMHINDSYTLPIWTELPSLPALA